MTKRVLVTGGTKDDVAPIAVFIINVKNTNAHLFDKVIIFHDGIKFKDQQQIRRIMDVEFRLYKPKFSTCNGMVYSYFSPMVFCKYECIRLLDDYDEVVWSDYDVVIRKGMDEILKFDENICWNVTTSSSVSLAGKLLKDRINNEIIDKYDIEGQGICAALFVLRRGIGNPKELTEWCYEMTERYDDSLYLPEEAILSMMIQNFNIRYSPLDLKIYAAPAKSDDDSVVILHAAGVYKFWNAISNPTWNDNYAEWIGMGGSKYSEKLKQYYRLIRLIKSKIHRVYNEIIKNS